MWTVGGGTGHLNQMKQDLDAVNKAIAAKDALQLYQTCDGFGIDVKATQAYTPLPDPVGQRDWSAGLALYLRAATDCMSGPPDPARLNKVTAELLAGASDLTRTTTRMQAIADGGS